MPTYEYECESCGAQFEYFQWISEEPRAECEACGGSLKRLLSGGTGLIFKGSGVYITDYKGGAAGSKGGDGKSESKGDKPSESKAVSESSSAAGGAAKSEG